MWLVKACLPDWRSFVKSCDGILVDNSRNNIREPTYFSIINTNMIVLGNNPHQLCFTGWTISAVLRETLYRISELWGGQCVSSWRPLIWLGHLWYFVRVYIYNLIYNCVFGSLISGVTCNYVSADGGRDGLWLPALLGHWLSYTGCRQSLLVMYWLMFGVLFLFLPTSLGYFCPRTFRGFSNNGLNKLPWTPYLHAILRIISRGVSCLATDSRWGLLGPWMNHLPPAW